MTEIQIYFSKKQASNYLSNQFGLTVSDKTLSKYITTGKGPKYQKFGNRVVYQKQFLDEWVETRLSKPYNNSAEIGGVR